MAYAAISKPSLHFNTLQYEGNGSNSHAITGVGFKPDFVWIKSEDQNSYDHMLFDKVRGDVAGPYDIRSNLTNVQSTDSSGLVSFDTDGFTLNNGGYVNHASTFNSWNWKGSNATAVSNSDGSITSSVNANTAAGFSIVKYTGAGSDATVGHGLGAVPTMIMIKSITTTAHDWVVYHQGMGNAKAIALNLSNVEYGATAWQSTTPTNQVFYIKGGANSVSGSMDFIAYCWTDIKGYSKMGSYTGNGNTDGTFVYTGFKPAFVNFKRTTGAVANWQLWDNKRDIDNPVERAMHPDTNSLSSNDQDIDFLSNGFKIRSNQGHLNANNVNFIYQAFAEEPLVANVGTSIPATAR